MAASNPSCDLGRAEEGVAGEDLNGNGYCNGRSGKSFVSDEDEVEYRNSENINNNEQQFQELFSGSKLTRYAWKSSRPDDVIQFSQLNSSAQVESSGRSSRSLSGERFAVQQRSSQQEEDDHTRESSSSSSVVLHNSAGLETGTRSPPPTEDHFPASVYRPHPLFFTQANYTSYPTESEKLRKMRAGKERKEKLIKKNVKDTYKLAEDKEYNVDTILESLGEIGNPSSDDKKLKRSKPASDANSKKKPTDPTQPQSRKRSNGKDGDSSSRQRSSADESEDVSDASKDAETERDDSDFESSVKVKLDKSQSDDTPSDKPRAEEPGSSSRISSDIKDLIGFSGKSVTVNQPEPSGGTDLKRQTSKSTENLSSFTEVTKKRDRKKKSPTTDDSHDYRSSQQPFRPPPAFESRRFNANGAAVNGNPRARPEPTGGQQPHVSSASSTASQESSRSSSTHQTPSTVVAQNKFLGSGVRPNPPPAFSRPAPPQPAQQKSGSLDLSSSDFPPLEAEEGPASSAGASSAAWPLTRPAASAFFPASPPSGAASTSDHSAVISKTETKPDEEDDPSDSSSVKTLVPGGEWSTPSNTSLSSCETLVPSQVPPDVTKDAGLAGGARQFSLPDIAAQAPLGSVSSGESTPPCAGSEKPPSSHAGQSDYAECFEREGASSSRHSTASFFVDVDNNVEIVLTEDEYNTRRFGYGGELCAPVVIFGKGETPLQDWTSSSGFEFGFDLNDALLMSSSTSSVPSTLVGEDLQPATPQTGHQPLDHIDDAIVKFGPMAAAFPHGHYFDMANWHQHMAAFSQLHSSAHDAAAAAEEDVASGKSTPKAVQLETAEGKAASSDATATKAGRQRRSDYVETVTAINRRWEQVASELKSKAVGVVYFVPDSAQKAIA